VVVGSKAFRIPRKGQLHLKEYRGARPDEPGDRRTLLHRRVTKPVYLLLLSSVGVGAASVFQVAGGPDNPPQGFTVLRETRHRLVGLGGGGVGIVAGVERRLTDVLA
jgi:hypothetical protein